MADRPRVSAPRWRTLTTAASVVLLLALAGCGSGDDPPADQDAADRTATPTATPTPTASTAAPVDLAAFTPVDRAAWDAIVADPDSAAGQQVLVYAVVQRFYSATGPGTFQARVSTTQPADPTEGTGAVIRAQPEMLEGVEIGDVLELRAQVTGAFGGASGASSRTPELAAVAAEEVGLRDLTADVVLGAPVAGSGVTIPVTITNSADVAMDYRVDITARSADGKQNYGTMAARAAFLAPGQAGVVNVRFTGAVPEGAQFAVAKATRSPSPTQ